MSCREGETNKQNWKTYSTTLQFWMSLTKLRLNLCKFKSRVDSLAISRLIFAYMVRWHTWDDSAHHIVHGLVGVQYLVAPSTAACLVASLFHSTLDLHLTLMHSLQFACKADCGLRTVVRLWDCPTVYLSCGCNLAIFNAISHCGLPSHLRFCSARIAHRSSTCSCSPDPLGLVVKSESYTQHTLHLYVY